MFDDRLGQYIRDLAGPAEACPVSAAGGAGGLARAAVPAGLADAGTAVGTVDPRSVALRAAIDRLRRELARYRPQLDDRQVAEDELELLDRRVTAGTPPIEQLRHSLLLITAALGSVSALRPSLYGLHRAVNLFAGIAAR